MKEKRRCTLCKNLKDHTDFYKHKHMKNGRRNQCSQCMKQAAQDKRESRRNLIFDIVGEVCNRCGVKYPRYVFDLHHRVPENKLFDIMASLHILWDRLLIEVEKCDLLCANCHKIVHYEMRMEKESENDSA